MKKDYAKRKNKTETEEWDYKPSVEWAYNPVKISLFNLMDMSSNIKKAHLLLIVRGPILLVLSVL